MGDLTGKRIDQTYDGLIKTYDEQPIDGTEKRLQDGVGNDLPVSVSTNGMDYYGVQDFTNATVLGVSGSGTSGTSGTSGSSGVSPDASEGYYGAFYDNNDQVIATPGIEQLVTISGTTISNGISLASNRISIANPGTYQLSATLQVTNDNNSEADVTFWLNFNGAPYPNSAHFVTLQPRKSSGSPSSTTVSFSFIGTSTSPGDYVELYWTSDTAGVTLNHEPSVGITPDAGSVYVNIGQVSEIQAATSGTSGSNGTSGTSGTSGSSGTTGTSGTSGTTGTSGTSGTSGSNGTSGTSGSSGTSGTSGSGFNIVQRSGTTIDFVTHAIFNTKASPGTGDLSLNFAGAVAGYSVIVIHNDTVTPNFIGAQWSQLVGSYPYVTGQDNLIYCQLIDSVVYYTIQQ
jgi:hypothetical protein